MRLTDVTELLLLYVSHVFGCCGEAIRGAIQRTENNMSWSPRPSDLAKSAMNFPKAQGLFLQTLLTGKKEWPDENCHPRVQRLRDNIPRPRSDV